MRTIPTYDATALGLWQRCPRRFWFERVQGAPLDHSHSSFSLLLGQAAHAGIALALREPGAGREQVLVRMQETFHQALAGARNVDPEALAGALARLEEEHLDLVLRLRADERVRLLEWLDLELPLEWHDARGRRFSGRLNALGRATRAIPGFGRRGAEPVDLPAGALVLVDWRFGRRVDVTPTALALNLHLAFWQRGLERTRGLAVRTFVGAARDLVPPGVVHDEQGDTVPRVLEELNPEYVAAFAAGRAVDAALLEAAESSRRRFSREGRPIPKRLRRPNPLWQALAERPRGPLFHEAHTAWSVLHPAIGRSVLEIEAAAASGREESYPARGQETYACATCPFRGRCLAGARSLDTRAGRSAS